MGLETATYINGLVTTNPTSSDPKSQGDDHLRLVKSTVKATFPNITGAVTPTQTDLNVLLGVGAGGAASININGTVGATTPAAGAFTSLNTGQLAGLRNKIINGDFSQWQRGTSFTASGYSADRMNLQGPLNITLSQQPRVAGDISTYRLRIAATNASNGYTLTQALESFQVDSLKGKTVTFSFYVTGGATGAVGYGIQKNSTANTDGSGWTSITSTTFSPSATLTRYSITAAIPDDGTANGLRIFFSLSNQANGTSYDLQGLQLEIGSVATPFEQRPIGMELALCQRYYYRLFPTTTNKVLGSGMATSTTTFLSTINFPSPMRTPPTALEQSGTANQYTTAYGPSATVLSAVPAFVSSTDVLGQVSGSVAAGLTTGAFVQMRTDSTNGASAYLGFSAEL